MSLARNISDKYKKELLDAWLDSLKTSSKTIVHKTGKFLGQKIADVVKIKTYWKNSYSTNKKKRNIKGTTRSIIKNRTLKNIQILEQFICIKTC